VARRGAPDVDLEDMGTDAEADVDDVAADAAEVGP